MLLEGKVGVVTGGAMGIGQGIAIALAEHGADVASLDIEALENSETAARVHAIGRRCLALDCDVGSSEQVRHAIAQVLAKLGRIDVLVNNAALFVDTSLTGGSYATQAEAYFRSIASCALGGYYCALAVVPAMQRNGGGNIINIVTEHIKEGHYINGSRGLGYDSAKWTQWRQTVAWANELGPLGIRVNALCPGATDTRMCRGASPWLVADGKGMRPADLGQAVINIISQGVEGPVGQSYLIGASGSETGRADIAALLAGAPATPR